MPRKKKNPKVEEELVETGKELSEEESERLKEKLAKIGEFVEEKTEEEKPETSPSEEEAPKEETPSEEVPPEEIPKVPPEVELQKIREKILKLFAEIGSRGLKEEERQKFLDDFNYWDGVLYDILDIGNNFQQLLGKTQLKVSPVQAVLIYLVGSIALIVLLRKDLQERLFKKQKPPEEAK